MDSCEYLSKHFGTQTIHKASESDAKDARGSSSKTEDVMQKSLLSAEDIFAMKKDGECAIVVKGADPLYQTKCRMERTDFVKLLCRKHNPYDPKRRQEIRKAKRADSSPVFFSGDRAKAEAKKLITQGEEIVHITVDEAVAYHEAIKMNIKPENIVLSVKERQMLQENAEKYREKHAMMKKITLEEFKANSDGSECEESVYRDRCRVVRSLINDGFSNIHVRFLKPMILAGYSFDDIKELFNQHSDTEEIKDFINQMGIA